MKTQDIVIVTDYHAKSISYRWLDQATGEERTFSGPTDLEAIASVLAEAQSAAKKSGGSGGKVVWIMESTTGWARMEALVGGGAQFILAFILLAFTKRLLCLFDESVYSLTFSYLFWGVSFYSFLYFRDIGFTIRISRN